MNKATENARDKFETLKMLVRARMRSTLVKPLKEYLDQKKPTSHGELVARMNQWLALWGDERLVFAKHEGKRSTAVETGKRKGLAYFLCGKLGHVARECRSKKETPVRTEDKTGKEYKTPKSGKVVSCFVYWEAGHKSPACSQRKDKTAKRVVTG